jgi:hypothetical protein
MDAIVIDSRTLPEPLFSFIGAGMVKVSKEEDKVILTRAKSTDKPSKKLTIDEIFSGLQFDFGDNYKFDRNEANDYE